MSKNMGCTNIGVTIPAPLLKLVDKDRGDVSFL